MVSRIKHIIGGELHSGLGPVLQSYSPSHYQVIGTGYEASFAQVQSAVDAAYKTASTWRDYTLQERYRFLKRYQTCLELEKEDLATLISQEMGKPIWESRLEVSAMIKKVDISYDAYQERCPEKEVSLATVKSVVRHSPHGVLVVMGPFNFPGHLPNGHIVPALLAGNTIVFKPSEYTPLVGQRLGELLMKSGIPNGVVNVVCGGRDVGKALIENPQIAGVLFTGSSTTGRYLASYFGAYPDKLLALEMGGNNALIVDSFADLNAAAWTIIQSAFLTSGQRCTCARRLILTLTDNNQRLLNRVIELASQLVVGDSLDPYVFMGPVIHSAICDDIITYQAQLKSQGGIELLSSKRPFRNGYFLTPGIMDVSTVSSVLDQEFFGPFLQVYWVDSLETAVSKANETRYGLAASVISTRQETYDWVRTQLHVGIVNWNMPTNGASSLAPFGGVGDSGNYRPSAYYAADYCAYPVASMEVDSCQLPEALPPGVCM